MDAKLNNELLNVGRRDLELLCRRNSNVCACTES